jgi:hypothetical protein
MPSSRSLKMPKDGRVPARVRSCKHETSTYEAKAVSEKQRSSHQIYRLNLGYFKTRLVATAWPGGLWVVACIGWLPGCRVAWHLPGTI